MMTCASAWKAESVAVGSSLSGAACSCMSGASTACSPGAAELECLMQGMCVFKRAPNAGRRKGFSVSHRRDTQLSRMERRMQEEQGCKELAWVCC